MLGEVMARGAAELAKPEVLDFFARLIQRVTPKSWTQARGEPIVVRKWMENYSGDSVRYLARSFGVPGDHHGQTSTGIRMPFGGVSVITPFNFPLEIPALQCMSALFMGNQVTAKVDEKVQVVMEQYLRMMHSVGLPMEDLDLIYCDGPTMNQLLLDGDSRMCLFTGSQHIAEKLAVDLKGKVKLEDAGFDWKIFGPDAPAVGSPELEFAVWQADQDAYSFSGQKCSAQSFTFIHENWEKEGVDLVARLVERASHRKLEDFTICPVLTWSNEAIEEHLEACLAIPGAEIAFGGKPLPHDSHSIPQHYGSFEPTAVRVPLQSLLADKKYFVTATKELFGPFQVLVDYKTEDVPHVLELLNSLDNHLTAAIVSNDVHFVNHILANTINGTTYAGQRARTTAAPQQHWFGPSGDPRSAGIHTAEAIQLCWSSHREIIYDWGPVGSTFEGTTS